MLDFSSVKFPVFLIRSHYKLYAEDNIDYIETYHNKYIIDNKNLTGDTLGVRRLKLKDLEFPLYPLAKSINTPEELIFQKPSKQKYIDSTGYIFTHKKTKMHPIVCLEIIEKIPIEGKGYLIRLRTCQTTFLVSRDAIRGKRFARILKTNFGHFLYSLETDWMKDTLKKI